ncbi:helix-turn-helix domain-containing protein [Enterococcus sp. AZ109]|uniref:helix-turn-helix domain-containing protein n=1 Tax=Enterococcus sp. AZ109 TaxID=2774634 RepID=UPI003F27B7E3
MKIGEQLKEHRTKSELTQAEVAEKIFVSVRSISNWENGRNMPDIESVIRLAKFYQLSLDELLLEGSDMVEEMKKQEQALRFTQILFLGTMLTGILLLAIIYLMPEKTAKWLQFTIMGAFATNLIPMVYFQVKIRNLKGHPYDWEKEMRHSRIASLVFVVLTLIFIAYLYTL